MSNSMSRSSSDLQAGYPSLESVESASSVQILRWHRFLPSPMTDQSIAVIDRIGERLSEFKAADPADMVKVSKFVGWTQ